jgi:ElaB/YqjD/DUF883 family membrane-anchored ribosome-binding protein
MFTTKSLEQPGKLTNRAIKSTQRVASEALENLADALVDLRQQAEPLLNRTSDQVSAFAHHGIKSVRDTSRQLQKKAQRASDHTLNYIQDEPVKSILIAAAVGAVVVSLVSLISHLRDED